MIDTFLGNQETGERLLLSPTQRAGHMLALGHCRSGKTELMRHIAAQDIAAGRNVVVFDPASDPRVFSSVVEAAEKSGRAEDLALLAPGLPNYSITIDPLAKQFFSSEMVAANLLSLWGRSWDEGASPFVLKTFRTAVAAARVFNVRDDGGRQHILNTLERMSTPEEMRDLLGSWFKQSASVFKPERGNLPLNRLMSGQKIILVVHPDAFGHAETGRVFFSMLMACLKELANNEEAQDIMAVHMDEAQLFSNLAALGELLVCKDMENVWLSAYCQDPDQIYETTKECYAKAFFEHIKTKLFFRSSTPSALTLARPLFGKRFNDYDLKKKLSSQAPGEFVLQDGTQWQSAAPIETEQIVGLPFAVVGGGKKARSLGDLSWRWKPIAEVSPATT